ncbi:hypothetical protein I79_008353 [Cricetulus griseus]|uniref:Uncharacterized protein n=1 Tax=Cricetulus griseus TaxID=10029 RepID=G3HCY5_CRIGR|nr:hypothetical protein I79_008353 [Cricetulus griseus]
MRGSLPSRVRLFGWSKTVGLPELWVCGAHAPGKVRSCRPAGPGAQGAGRGTPGRTTGVGWGCAPFPSGVVRDRLGTMRATDVGTC